MCFRKEKHVCWASLLFFFLNCFEFHCIFFFFDRLRSKTPSFSFSSSRNPSSPLSRLQRPLLLSFLPPFFLLLCVRLRRWKIVTVVCLKCLRSTYSVKKKKKSGWMSYLAIFGTHALLVHILWQFWRWNAESGCPSHGSRSARKCKKKKKKLLRTLFFFWVFAVAES